MATSSDDNIVRTADLVESRLHLKRRAPVDWSPGQELALAALNNASRSRSHDPDNYRCARPSEMLETLIKLCGNDCSAVLDGLDMCRRAYDITMDDFPDTIAGAREALPWLLGPSHPFFKLLSCVSVACKINSRYNPSVFGTLQLCMNFSYASGAVLYGELDAMRRCDFAPFKIARSDPGD